MKYLSLLAFLVLNITACRKDNQNFKLKTVTINAYPRKNLPLQHIYVRIVDAADTALVLDKSDLYPSNLPLPVVLKVSLGMKKMLYKNSCVVQLWGDLSGLLSSEKLNMTNYKIIFPLEMDVENREMNVKLSGSWD